MPTLCQFYLKGLNICDTPWNKANKKLQHWSGQANLRLIIIVTTIIITIINVEDDVRIAILSSSFGQQVKIHQQADSQH